MKTMTQAEAVKVKQEREKRYGRKYVVLRLARGHYIVRVK